MTTTQHTSPERVSDVFGASLSRRGFVKAGGALLVGFGFAKAGAGQRSGPALSGTTVNAALPESWIELHSDDSILIRVGKPDFGTGSVFTAYRQIVAEELSVPFEAITTVISGDTDRTPDGSGAFDFLGGGMPNIRKAAAYVHQALLDLASEQLRVPKDQLSVKDGIVSGGAKTISYGALVKNQKLNLTIPVKGDVHSMFGLIVDGEPPLKPISRYMVIGKSFPNPVTVSKVSARETWVTDVQQVASGTEWSAWKGLPGDGRLFQINPAQLKRQVEGGTVMGLGMTLFEEPTFDESGVVTSDWRTYPIATMADLPDINVVLNNRPEVGKYVQGSEAANALASSAITGAFLDATGKVARRTPLKPEYVQALLKV